MSTTHYYWGLSPSAPAVPLAAPTNMQATYTSPGTLSVTANSVANATGYQLYRSATSTGSFAQVGALLGTPSLTDAGLVQGASYYYQWQAIGNGTTFLDSPRSPVFSGFTSAAPLLNAFDPTGGTVGLTVSLMGNNFTGATSVRFNGVAASFTVASPSSITATVPTGALRGKVEVTTPAGTALSPTDFLVWGALVETFVDDPTVNHTYGPEWAAGSYSLATWANGTNHVSGRVAAGLTASFFIQAEFGGSPDEGVTLVGQVDFGAPYQIWEGGIMRQSYAGQPTVLGPPGSGETPGPIWTSDYPLSAGTHTFEVRRLPSDNTFVTSTNTEANQHMYYDGFRRRSRAITTGTAAQAPTISNFSATPQ